MLLWLCSPAGSQERAEGPRPGVLDLYLTSEGRPTAARVYISDESGKPHLVAGTVTYSRAAEEHSIVDQSAAVPLPPGQYRIRAEKGLEFRPAEKTVTLAAGEPTRADLEIPRFYNMNQQGWYSGDLHIHRPLDDMPLLVRAEDLNIAPTITRHLGGRPQATPFPRSPFSAVDQTHIIGQQNQEVERLGKGHGAVLLLNIPRPIEPNWTVLHPMELEFCRLARSQGGFIDGEKPIWKNIPINVALGVIDAIGVVNNHFHPRRMQLEAEKWGSMEREDPVYKTPAGFAQWMTDLYYSFLNCGFRLPVSAGAASGIMPTWPGYARVYVHLSGAFGYDQWFHDLKSGRSFATNGPLLEVALDGQVPGAQINWEGPLNVTLAVQARSQNPLDRIEIIYNGAVIRSFPAGANAVFVTAVNLTITEPGWLAVRCFEAAGETIRLAHTSPFYFLRDGKLPVKKAAARQWADFVRKLAASVDPADYPTRGDYEKAQRTFREAEAVYRRLGS